MGLPDVDAFLTQLLGGRAAPVLAALFVAGLILWSCGARFGRSIFTLVGVTAGAYLGLHLPARMGWGIDGIATAFAGALLLGLAGWALHTTWVGATLCVMLAASCATIAWVMLAPAGAGWTPPAIDWSQPHVEILKSIWLSLPGPDLPRAMPYSIGAGLIVGACVTLGWPKLARVMAFSLVGTALMTGSGLLLAHRTRPGLLEQLPGDASMRIAIIGAIAVVGMVIQWLILPRSPKLKINVNDKRTPSDVSSGQAPSLEALRRAKAFPAANPLAAGGSIRA